MSEVLQRAFGEFERAATTLSRGQERLLQRVDHLEQELVSANGRLEAVLDAVDSGVAVVAGDRRVIRTNRSFDAFGLVDDKGLDGLRLSSALPNLGDRTGVVRVQLGDGRGARDLMVTFSPVGDDGETVVLTVKDTTAIRREEEEGGRRHRLEALGRLAAELAHELRNPLGAIRLFAGLLQGDHSLGSRQRGLIDHVVESVGGLEATVTNLLSFAAPCRLSSRPVDLLMIARESCRMLDSLFAARGVSLVVPGGTRPCLVNADPEGLRQVLLNLLGNALAATQRSGEVIVRVSATPDLGLLEVTDNGGGIPTVDLPRVFDPFFSRTEGGTGLGLSIVHGIVQHYGGRIALESKVDEGTTVLVELKVATEAGTDG